MINLQLAVLWVVTTPRLVDEYNHFRGTYSPIFRDEDEGSTFLRNVGTIPTTQHGVTTQVTDNYFPKSSYLVFT